MMSILDPFELHPDTPRLSKSRDSIPLTLGQLDSIITDIVERMHESPDKPWGHSKTDLEYWIKMIIHEAEKIPNA